MRNSHTTIPSQQRHLAEILTNTDPACHKLMGSSKLATNKTYSSPSAYLNI